MDKVSKEVRSEIMSKIRSTHNRTTEVRLRSSLVRNHVRGWKVRPKGIIGNPDFIFPAQRIVIFVDGAFWHGAPDFKRFPKTRLKYWKKKIEGNRERDQIVNRSLRRRGWVVLRFWDYQLAHHLREATEDIKKKVERRANRTRKKTSRKPTR